MATAKQIAARKLFAARAKAGTLRKNNPSDDDMSAADWARRMSDLRLRKPRPIAKLYGANGPTKEQYEQAMRNMKAWEREYRLASKMQKIALERDNAAYAARLKNPSRGGNDAIHIDIDSHNTGGKNVRAKNPRKSPAASMPTDKFYIVEMSKNGKVWEFIDSFWGPGSAKECANRMHEEYPDFYVRVSDKRVK